MTGALLALALAASPPLAQEEWPLPPDEQEEHKVRHLSLSVWGGEAFDESGSGASFGVVGAEAAWSFSSLDVGLAGYRYEGLPGSQSWIPVTMLRLTQRFPLRTGVEATFALGVGAVRRTGWEAWFQVALGMRVPLGPMFVGGELGFERGNLLRLAGGLGVTF